MPTIVFDGPDKCIEIQYAAGEDAATVKWNTLYKNWVDWVASSTCINSKYAVAFQAIQYPTTDTQSIGPIFFLDNGWKICPAPYVGIASTTLTLDGDCYPTIPGTPMFGYGDVPAGQHTHITNVQSNIAIAVGSSGLTLESIARQILDLEVIETVGGNPISMRQSLRLANTYTAGDIIGGPDSPSLKSLDGTKNRIVGTADVDGNRSRTSLDLS